MSIRGPLAPVWFAFLAVAVSNLAVASEADALAISRNIVARHLPYGTILDPMFAAADSNQIIGYTRCGDSAIWTGFFLAAEAYHYKATASPEALSNVKAAIAGLKSLADVTGTNLLARCLVPLNSTYAPGITQEEKSNGIYTNQSAGWYWVGNTSRDQYSGVFFGLAVAYDLVDDAQVRSSITDLTTRLLGFLTGHDWIVVMPDGSPSTTFIGRADQQLSFLQVGRRVNPSRFSVNGFENLLLSADVLAPIAIEVTSNDSYYKFNLDYINLYDLLRLEDSVFKPIHQKAYDLLRNHTRDQQNAFFNMIDRALNSPDAARDAQTTAMLDQWLTRPRRDVYVDLRGKLPSCNSADDACDPIPVPLRVTTDFLWQRSPFQLDGGGSGTIESAGIDYILPYWMARVYGVIGGASSVVSAASGSPAVAPESIVSFFGALPSGGGGVSIQVQDSAGVSRPATLFFTSTNQANFEIPAGTAPGQAQVNILDSTGGNAASAPATVQNVAPALFTADSSGKGVAAALAIHVIAVVGPQTSAPIFQCSNGTCTSIPINLGIDTPTYLSLFGTGLRNRSSLANVTVTIHGVSVPVLYAGAQGVFPGLDQVNVAVPLALRGSGETDLVLTVDGQAANTVRVNIQ